MGEGGFTRHLTAAPDKANTFGPYPPTTPPLRPPHPRAGGRRHVRTPIQRLPSAGPTRSTQPNRKAPTSGELANSGSAMSSSIIFCSSLHRVVTTPSARARLPMCRLSMSNRRAHPSTASLWPVAPPSRTPPFLSLSSSAAKSDKRCATHSLLDPPAISRRSTYATCARTLTRPLSGTSSPPTTRTRIDGWSAASAVAATAVSCGGARRSSSCDNASAGCATLLAPLEPAVPLPPKAGSASIARRRLVRLAAKAGSPLVAQRIQTSM
eukprot:scaffold9302_cov56-Phaeocystis_antarctica.AAC.2